MTEDARAGRERIDWTATQMPMLAELKSEFLASTPFAGRTIGICLHVEPKTAVLCDVLRAGGAKVAITGSPGTTQDDVAAALAVSGCRVFTHRADSLETHRGNVALVVEEGPDLLLDNGADLVATAIARGATHNIAGATEETTTGANRLREELASDVGFPVIVINDSPLKLIVENEHGVGQSVVQAFMQVTNLMLPGRRAVVIGYGWCGRGIARTLRKLGAHVAVVEHDAIRALEAAVDGMTVGDLAEFLPWGEVFFTVTGRPGILGVDEFAHLPDGAILANAGHFSWEIDLVALRQQAASITQPAAGIERLEMPDGRHLSVLTGGEMLNLAGGGGNPIEAMDLGLTLQARSLELLATAPPTTVGPQPVPDAINRRVARVMLAAMRA